MAPTNIRYSGTMSELGQKAKYSLREHIVRFAPDSGLKSDMVGGPFRAKRGLMHRNKLNIIR
jgi:hypothetical protein